ncbi:hypothetical protein F3Y22_tig00111847pilonHSYRG00125 [Hibiscus syriacus]|uniref:beta-galactosidase n=1 Tax=Hibiscus syriacus TaxID=106335 RepID=A0A6A2XR00_HIBSY|nr:hypothetical protein F3Y22_tig00111847pilonHSYRG00125 [Hibiscus syriacus]
MLSFYCSDFAYNYLEGTTPSECASMNLTFASTITYDSRAIVIDEKHRVLVSGSIHYPRSTPDYNFEGRNDLVKFVKLVATVGLYVHLRIGPYVCVEWNYGGFPLWLHFIPGIKFRTDNEPFKIENEYGNIDSAYGAGLVRQPKWGHLRDVHKAIKLCEEAMIATDPTISSLGPNLENTNQIISVDCVYFICHGLLAFIFT